MNPKNQTNINPWEIAMSKVGIRIDQLILTFLGALVGIGFWSEMTKESPNPPVGFIFGLGIGLMLVLLVLNLTPYTRFRGFCFGGVMATVLELFIHTAPVAVNPADFRFRGMTASIVTMLLFIWIKTCHIELAEEANASNEPTNKVPESERTEATA